jgi:hypothetical protein
MKKLSVLAIAAIFTLGLSSCKKDWTCTCTTTVTGFGTTTVSGTIKDTKKNAKEECDKGDATTSVGSTACEID